MGTKDVVLVDDLCRFINRVLGERERLEAALHADWHNAALQASLVAWRDGVEGFAPAGATSQVIDELEPTRGRKTGPLKDHYLRAMNEAVRELQQAIIPTVREVYERSRDSRADARNAYESSTRQLPYPHSSSVCFLIDFVDATGLGPGGEDEGSDLIGGDGSGSEWLPQVEVARRMGLKRFEIHRLLESGELSDNGKLRHRRRVNLASVIAYCKAKGMEFDTT